MARPVFPTSLPAVLPYQLNPDDQAVRTDDPQVPLSARRITEQPSATAKVGWRFLKDDFEVFREWWETELLRGHKWFDLKLYSVAGYVNHVVRFLGPYVSREMAYGYREVTAEIEIRERQMKVTGPTYIINLDGNGNAGNDSSVGVLLNGLNAATIYELTLPTGQLYTGYSAWASDTATSPGIPPPLGEYWGNRFYATGGAAVQGFNGADTTGHGTSTGYPDGPAARAGFGAAIITGYTQYRFWIFDNNPSDNRGGLSIQVQALVY